MSAPNERRMYREVLRLAIAAAVVVAALWARQQFFRYLGINLPPFITFFPAVILDALLFGLWAGLLATALSSLLAAIWVFPPHGLFRIQNPSDIAALVVFMVVGVAMSFLAECSRARQALRDSQAKLAGAMESMSDAVFICDAKGKFLEFNHAFATFHRFKDKATCATTLAQFSAVLEVFHADGTLASLSHWPVSLALQGESLTAAEYLLRRKDTGETWIASYNSSPIRNASGKIIGVVLAARDITAQKRSENALMASEARYRTAFQTSLDAILITRVRDEKYIDVNQRFLDITGYDRGELIGHNGKDLPFWADGRDQENMAEMLRQRSSCRDVQAQFKKKNGELFWGIASASIIELDCELCVLSVVRDISEAKLAAEEIRNLAFYDPLTGLANRRLLLEQLRKSIAFSARSHRKRALLFVDLDDFKTLNDTLGHPTGDLLLREVSRRLADCITDIDTLSRFGGDEFVLLIEDLGPTIHQAMTAAQVMAQKVLAGIDQPYLLEGRECFSTCSIGITVFGDNDEDCDDVLKQADLALHQAKAAGKNTMRFFAPALQATANARASMEEDLRHGIKAGEFMLYYQPQVQQHRVVGAEALLRWNHPRMGVLLPGKFISLAEQTRLILPLGDWVLEAACRQIAAWAEHRPDSGMKIAVNISAVQWRKQDFVDCVLRALECTRANPHQLTLELTESMLLDNVEDVVAKMTALKSYGLSFSLDDFGTGYSSLAYLKRLPLDQLKIDRSFVRDILDDESSVAIAQTIITLSQAMGLPVIAEGVETEQQRTLLDHLGCHCFQGYLFGKPQPAEEFEAFLADFAAPPFTSQ